MSIPSGAPDRDSARCPSCNAKIHIESAILFGDAVCPTCENLFGFVQFSHEVRFFDPEIQPSIREHLIKTLSARLHVDADEIPNHSDLLDQLKLDSLDQVELIMELEEEFDWL